jgi:hypothetical protein
MLALGILFVLFGLVSLDFFAGGGKGPDLVPPVEKTKNSSLDGRRIPSAIDAVVADGVEEIRVVRIEAVTKKRPP